MRRATQLVLAMLVLISVPARGLSSPHDSVIRRRLASDRLLEHRRYPAGRELVRLPSAYLRAGDNRMLYGRLRAQNLSRRNIGQLVGIGCGGRIGGTVVTTRNNEGAGYRSGPGPGVLTLSVRYLLVAESSGWYRCALWGRALHPGPLVAVARGGETFLEMSRASLPGAAQRFEEKCAASGEDPTCVYLVPASTRQRNTSYPSGAYVLDLPRYGWAPAEPVDTALYGQTAGRAGDVAGRPGAWTSVAEGFQSAPTFVHYVADLQVTTCYQRTASCLGRASQYGAALGSLVETQAEILQTALPQQFGQNLIPQIGTACPVRTLGAPTRTWVGNGAHHQKIHHVLRHWLVPSGCGRDVFVRLRVTVLNGNPLKVEAGPMPNYLGTGKLFSTAWYSNAIVTLS
jgi:hypothetical protein